MKGIGRFGVNEAQDVKIVPDGGELALGRTELRVQRCHQAGKFELAGARFEFDYDAFKLEVRQAESLRIKAEIDGNTCVWQPARVGGEHDRRGHRHT